MITDEQAKSFLAVNLTRILRNRGLSQNALARMTNESPMRISTICRGTNVPDIACVARIAEALDVSIDALVRPVEAKAG